MPFLTVNKVLKQRLLGAIDSLKNERENYVTDKHNEDALDKINKAIKHAEDFANRHEFELGWNQFFIAEQELVKCMTADQRIIKANSLRIEASVITGRRQDQIYGLLGKPAKEKEPPPPEINSSDKIIEVLRIKNDFNNTRNNRMAIRKAASNTLAIALVVLIIAIITLSFFHDLINSCDLSFKIILAFLLGMLGASFSLASSLLTTSLEVKIPVLLVDFSVTIIRLAIGGVSAFIILMFLHAGFLDNLFNEKILASGYTLIVVSFLAGFSERWVIGILESVIKEKDKEAEKK